MTENNSPQVPSRAYVLRALAVGLVAGCLLPGMFWLGWWASPNQVRDRAGVCEAFLGLTERGFDYEVRYRSDGRVAATGGCD